MNSTNYSVDLVKLQADYGNGAKIILSLQSNIHMHIVDYTR